MSGAARDCCCSPAAGPRLPNGQTGTTISQWSFNVLNTRSQGVRTFALALERVTAPLYRPIRRILPDFGGLDFSPLVVLILIQVLQKLLTGVHDQYYYGG
jgi:YggT family protein